MLYLTTDKNSHLLLFSYFVYCSHMPTFHLIIMQFRHTHFILNWTISIHIIKSKHFNSATRYSLETNIEQIDIVC